MAKGEGKTTRYLKYAIGEILKCPVRDNISVEKIKNDVQRAFRYAISEHELYAVPKGTENILYPYCYL
uniref:hypothetical protein n=1 Tax=Mariniflexile sp. TaxID=1979402 RepID=UPI0040470FF0